MRARFLGHLFDRDLERHEAASRARDVAERARAEFEDAGVPRPELVRCASEGRDGTRLAGRLKVYLPLNADERPFRMIFSPIVHEHELALLYLAFGVGHQPRGSHAPTVYEIAHRRVHGRWP